MERQQRFVPVILRTGNQLAHSQCFREATCRQVELLWRNTTNVQFACFCKLESKQSNKQVRWQ